MFDLQIAPGQMNGARFTSVPNLSSELNKTAKRAYWKQLLFGQSETATFDPPHPPPPPSLFIFLIDEPFDYIAQRYADGTTFPLIIHALIVPTFQFYPPLKFYCRF